MKAVKLRPFVPSGKDYALAQRFFEELGFDKIYSDDGLSVFRIGEQEFFLQNFHDQSFQDNYMLELAVEDLDGWWSRLQAVLAANRYPAKAKEPTVYPWGKREIHLIDPSGVCWHLSEAAEAFR
ncbi:VOC family protein [Paenibacillus arenilitoris]|uniref:Glyoxalase n=1 Tax=Paenibacillus arenilitoris TaxID=2772299 RepID=A0A927CJT1_9BACL|nr:glyoxalase [Paenibacillus arenilitoris]MBD2868770.1 glyoxalase [Paenibacillus arenilitoris]